MQTTRRNFFRQGIAGAAVLASIPSIVASATENQDKSPKSKIVFSEGEVVLLQGDSITDAGRDRNNESPNSGRSFGNGYAFLIAANLLNAFPEKNLSVYNRGISGNKVYQLAERWDKDAIGLKPGLLSILIGVNDYWHKRNGNYDGTTEIYETDYRKLLDRTKDALPDVKLVICEPFILTGTTAVDESWIEPFKVYQEIAAKIAREFGALWVPFQKVFTEATKYAPSDYWTGDGVHPSMAGAQLMAEAWKKVVLQE